MTKAISPKTLSITARSLHEVDRTELHSLAKAADSNAVLRVSHDHKSKQYSVYFKKPGALNAFKNRLAPSARQARAKALIVILAENHNRPAEAFESAWKSLMDKGNFKAGTIASQQARLLGPAPKTFEEMAKVPQLMKQYTTDAYAQAQHNLDELDFLREYDQWRHNPTPEGAKALREKYVPTPAQKKAFQVNLDKQIADLQAQKKHLEQRAKALEADQEPAAQTALAAIRQEMAGLGSQIYDLTAMNDGHAVNVDYAKTDAAPNDEEALRLADWSLRQVLDNANSEHKANRQAFLKAHWPAPAEAKAAQ